MTSHLTSMSPSFGPYPATTDGGVFVRSLPSGSKQQGERKRGRLDVESSERPRKETRTNRRSSSAIRCPTWPAAALEGPIAWLDTADRGVGEAEYIGQGGSTVLVCAAKDCSLSSVQQTARVCETTGTAVCGCKLIHRLSTIRYQWSIWY